MARELERAVVALVLKILGATPGAMPAWLMRPGKTECGGSWDLVQGLYRELTQLELPATMRQVERRKVDEVLEVDGQPSRVLEVDEKQHFNEFRAATLRQYKERVPVAFDVNEWIRRCEQKTRLEGAGFAAPKPPLFPGPNGRHRQRAFRDALADVLPPEHEWLPTLRVADFEVKTWIYGSQAFERMAALLEERLR